MASRTSGPTHKEGRERQLLREFRRSSPAERAGQQDREILENGRTSRKTREWVVSKEQFRVSGIRRAKRSERKGYSRPFAAVRDPGVPACMKKSPRGAIFARRKSSEPTRVKDNFEVYRIRGSKRQEEEPRILHGTHLGRESLTFRRQSKFVSVELQRGDGRCRIACFKDRGGENGLETSFAGEGGEKGGLPS